MPTLVNFPPGMQQVYEDLQGKLVNLLGASDPQGWRKSWGGTEESGKQMAGTAANLLGFPKDYGEAVMGGLGASMMPALIEARPVPLQGVPKLGNIWGERAPQTMEFRNLERMPGLAHEKRKALFTGVSEPNLATRELTAAHEGGLITDMTQIENYFKSYLNRDEAGKSLFDRSFQRQIDLRRDLMRFKEYNPEKQSFTAGRKNIKTEEAIAPFDCSRGCVGFCPECYAAFGKSTLQSHAFPSEVEWIGHVSKSQKGDLIRIGENGEPGFNPMTWKNNIEPEYRKLMESDRHFTPQELHNLVEPAYDWSYFNEQARKVGLDTPKGQEKSYIITKLQGLRNFDPNLARNLEVSIDTLTPDHFFRTLRNIEEIKKINPDHNIMMRIRSIASSNDEINSLQKIAVDFANRNNIPVLETRLRFKSGEGGMMAEVLPEYIWSGGQYVHQSYYPSIFPKPQHRAQKVGKTYVNRFEAHTAEGPKDTGISMVYEGKASDNPMTEVWVGGQGKVATLPMKEAREMAMGLAKEHGADVLPTKQVVWDINRNESPLSQFGLNPTLHYQCNAYNVSGPACKECGSCKAFTQLQKAVAK